MVMLKVESQCEGRLSLISCSPGYRSEPYSELGSWVLELVTVNFPQGYTQLYFQQKKIQPLNYIAKGSFLVMPF